VKAQRVQHLRIDIVVMSLEIVAQMLNPYTPTLVYEILKKFDRLTTRREGIITYIQQVKFEIRYF
jgi:hypothetical protein